MNPFRRESAVLFGGIFRCEKESDRLFIFPTNTNNNPHVKRAVFRLPFRAYTSQALKRLVKTGHRVYFYITILVNRSVQLVARNHECPKALNNVPCVIWSCIKMHATHEIVNYASRLIILFVQQVARNHKCPKALNNVPCVIWSCIKMHATHEIVN